MQSILAFIFLISIILLIVGLINPRLVLWKVKDKSRKKALLIYGLTALGSVIIAAAITTPEQKEQARQVAVEERAKKLDITISPTQSIPSQQTINKEEEITIYDAIWTDIDSAFKTREGYHTSYHADTKTVKLTYTKEEFWDNNEVVRTAYSNLVKYGTEAFKHPEIEELTAIVKTSLIDEYGKKSTQEVVSVTMSKEEFEKFEWKNYEFLSVYEPISSKSDYHWIHPAIAKGLDYEKLYLKP